jgi:hypothetical protein
MKKRERIMRILISLGSGVSWARGEGNREWEVVDSTVEYLPSQVIHLG